MLTFTENAAVIIKRLATAKPEPDSAGLRIQAPGSGSGDFTVEVSVAPNQGDEVVESNGARVFLDAEVAPALSNKELDAIVNGEDVRFLLREQR